MRVTFILRHLTEAFFDGAGEESIQGLNSMSDAEKFAYLNKYRTNGTGAVSMKIGSGQFRDAVGLNSMLRAPVAMTYKLEPRKGYKLATFEISRA